VLFYGKLLVLTVALMLQCCVRCRRRLSSVCNVMYCG